MQQLIDALSSRRYPVLTYLPESSERLELTGTVVANWVYKTTSLFAEAGVGQDLGVGIVLDETGPLHWRALAAMLAAFGLDAPVALLSADSEPPEAEWVAFADESHAADEITTEADEVFVYAAPALALAAEAPEGCIDFNSEVRAHPDVCPIPGTQISLTLPGGEQVASDSREVPTASGTELETTGIPVDGEELAAVLAALVAGTVTLSGPAVSM
ncbi:TIGR03089 family protein [Brevibacterium luteolum]|uniref:TIGR03089 family protein n=1 Tax=Brevibacterium luteolum TaxID=199591 RepID=UPI00223B6F99|nr:TIGR03089 family protein [Brevibacterium luteolum]MCT1828922.1 TIGR03089 family protein [Brevibacterium luteolum]